MDRAPKSGGQGFVVRERGPEASHPDIMRLQIDIGGSDRELHTLRFQAPTFQRIFWGTFEHEHLLTRDASSHANAPSVGGL
jgi:hypothetical protein